MMEALEHLRLHGRPPPTREVAQEAMRVTSARARPHVDGKFFAAGGERLRLCGVTYGPFAAAVGGEPFPARIQVRDDFACMRAAEINALRVYHPPPVWLLELADEQRLHIFVDVPWPKHLCFLESTQSEKEARRRVFEAAQRGRSHPSVLAYSIGNEIPPDIVRWYGARRVERFLAELCDVAKQADPDTLVTYANYPPTEYLDLSFLDFGTFNVYLHDPEAFHRYLFRLQNLVGDRPLLLGELGMDTLRHGEIKQADFLKGHVREAFLSGLAGVFVFSWTDEWHTGGHPITEWAFGITYADRMPKPSCHALREVFDRSTAELLAETPRVSVVVCTYNGGGTLDQCLRSLGGLNYPHYEIIVVDDGSTDDTRSIIKRYPEVKAIHQANHGLSTARNVGLRAATGSIIAYTDSDCFVDTDWLTHLVAQLSRSGAAAVGGPNLTPEDGRLAACVAAAPGQPVHVLESDQVAEHIPGCNMAYRREVLEAINGFDPVYRKAGDDVDVCWRLQQAGYWITFAPGAFVWHHRRQTPRAYLRQQAGYGEAEALLRFKHPDRFNRRGDGKWRGVLYGPSLQGLRLVGDIIYRGTFGTGLFQCLYQPAPAHWAMFPSTLEWHLMAAVVALVGVMWPLAALAAAVMLGISVAVAVLQARQARLSSPYSGFGSRVLVAGLCYVQPLVRSWHRYHTRFFSYRPPLADPAFPKDPAKVLPLGGARTCAYWTQEGYDRTELLGLLIAYLNEHAWGKTVDSGWEDWDLEIFCHPWTVLQVCTAQEEHGSGQRLIRIRYALRLSEYTKLMFAGSIVLALAAAVVQPWLAAGAATLFTGTLACWWRGTQRASHVIGLVNTLAGKLNLVPLCKEDSKTGRSRP